MPQEETEFNAKIKAKIEKLMPQAWVLRVQMLALRGIPDHMIFANKKFGFLEAKMDIEETINPIKRAKLQEYNIRKARNCGGYGSWITPCTQDKVLKEVVDFFYGG